MNINAVAFTLCSLVSALSAHAQSSTFAQGDAATGAKLHDEQACAACHARRLGGDGSTMYTRAERKVTTPSKLLAQVAYCNAELNSGLFPDDEAHIAAYLDRTYYRFK
jgi:hypothetical protein